MHRAAQLDPTFFFPVMSEGWLKLELGDYRAAVPFLARAARMDAPPFVTAYLAFAHGAAGDRAAAMDNLAALQKMAGSAPVPPFNLALVHLGLGDKAKTIAYLEQARAADSQMLGWLGRDHIFDSLRREPRFIALLKELNFTP